MTALKLSRAVTLEECPWLDRDYEQGEIVYRYDGDTCGCIGSSGVACTDAPDETPFFEFPVDALEPCQCAEKELVSQVIRQVASGKDRENLVARPSDEQNGLTECAERLTRGLTGEEFVLSKDSAGWAIRELRAWQRLQTSVAPDEVIETAAIAIMKLDPCGLTINGEHVLCCDQRVRGHTNAYGTPLYNEHCACREEARTALTAATPAIRAQVFAEIAASIRATMCDCSGKFIADALAAYRGK